MADQHAIERGDRDGILDLGTAVGRTQFQGRIFVRRPDRPPEMAGIADRSAQGQRGDIGIIGLVVGEQFGQARARQFVIGRQTIAAQAGQPPAPEGRGCRQRDEQRQIRQDAAHHVDALGRIGQCHMHMHAAQHVALADHLEILHHPVIALIVAMDGATPGGAGMSPGGCDGQAVIARHRRQHRAHEAKLRAHLAEARTGPRHRFGLGLQQFMLDPAIGAGEGIGEQFFLGRDRYLAGLLVDQEIFFFDSQRETAVLEIVGGLDLVLQLLHREHEGVEMGADLFVISHGSETNIRGGKPATAWNGLSASACRPGRPAACRRNRA